MMLMVSETSRFVASQPIALPPTRSSAGACIVRALQKLSLLPEALTLVPPSVLPPFKVPAKPYAVPPPYEVPPPSGEAPFRKLPPELLSLVARHLPKADILNLRKTCRTARRALQSELNSAMAPNLQNAGSKIKAMQQSRARRAAAKHYVWTVASLPPVHQNRFVTRYARQFSLQYATEDVKNFGKVSDAAAEWNIADDDGLHELGSAAIFYRPYQGPGRVPLYTSLEWGANIQELANKDGITHNGTIRWMEDIAIQETFPRSAGSRVRAGADPGVVADTDGFMTDKGRRDLAEQAPYASKPGET